MICSAIAARKADVIRRAPASLSRSKVCEKHYVFDAAAPNHSSVPLHFSPTAKCPTYEVPQEIATPVREKQHNDEVQLAQLISRGTPCRPTPHGEWLVRLGRQTRLLYAEASQAIASATAVDLPVAVNADSLGGWFRDVLAEAAEWDGTAIKLRVEDQAYSQELLRKGDVLVLAQKIVSKAEGRLVEIATVKSSIFL